MASMDDLEGVRCPGCDASLERGFVFTRQSRPRWTTSTKPFTVFAGKPLIDLPRGFWRFRRAMGTTSLPAGRCARCELAVFSFDRDALPRRSFMRYVLFSVGFALCWSVPMFAFLMLFPPTAESFEFHVISLGVCFFAFFGTIMGIGAMVETV